MTQIIHEEASMSELESASCRVSKFEAPTLLIVGTVVDTRRYLCGGSGDELQVILLKPEDVLEDLCPEVIGRVDCCLVEWSSQGMHALLHLTAQVVGVNMPVYACGELNEYDQIAALRIGAKGCFSIPVNVQLLSAHLDASGLYAYEHGMHTAPRSPGSVSRVGWIDREAPMQSGLRMEASSRRVVYKHAACSLGSKEYKLLELLMQCKGRCVQRETLIAYAWDVDFDTGTNILDVQIYSLRKKLASIGLPYAIETLRSLGYKLDL